MTVHMVKSRRETLTNHAENLLFLSAFSPTVYFIFMAALSTCHWWVLIWQWQPILFQLLPTVYDAVPVLKQHWVNVSCLLGCPRTCQNYIIVHRARRPSWPSCWTDSHRFTRHTRKCGPVTMLVWCWATVAVRRWPNIKSPLYQYIVLPRLARGHQLTVPANRNICMFFKFLGRRQRWWPGIQPALCQWIAFARVVHVIYENKANRAQCQAPSSEIYCNDITEFKILGVRALKLWFDITKKSWKSIRII